MVCGLMSVHRLHLEYPQNRSPDSDFPFRAAVSNKNRMPAIYVILIFLVAALIKVNGEIYFNTVFNPTLQDITIPIYKQYKLVINQYKLIKYYYYILCQAFEIWYIVHISSTSQFGQDTSQVLNSHVAGLDTFRALMTTTHTGSPGPRAPVGFYCFSTETPSVI